MKSTGIKITHQAVEKISVSDKDLKAVLQTLALFVGDKGQVCVHGASGLNNVKDIHNPGNYKNLNISCHILSGWTRGIRSKWLSFK